MPATRKYVVRETLEVEVSASTPTNALKAAEHHFLSEDASVEEGLVTGIARITDLSVYEVT